MSERRHSIGNKRQTGGEQKGKSSQECENRNRRKIHSYRHGDGDESCSHKKPTERKLEPVLVHLSSSVIDLTISPRVSAMSGSCTASTIKPRSFATSI